MHKKDPYQDFYSASYLKDISFRVNEKGVKVVRERLKEFAFSPHKKVLDVACGVSLLGRAFSNHVYGFDLNLQAVKAAKKNGIIAKTGDVEKEWDYPDEYFDIVIASHIIEHIVNPDHLILEAKRVLKKDGLFIVATPNLAAWFNRIFLPLGLQPFFTEVSTIDKTLGLKFTRKFTKLRNPLGHLRVFTPGSIKDLLELHGFKILKTSGLEFVAFPFPILVIDRIISRITSLASNIIVVGQKK